MRQSNEGALSFAEPLLWSKGWELKSFQSRKRFANLRCKKFLRRILALRCATAAPRRTGHPLNSSAQYLVLSSQRQKGWATRPVVGAGRRPRSSLTDKDIQLRRHGANEKASIPLPCMPTTLHDELRRVRLRASQYYAFAQCGYHSGELIVRFSCKWNLRQVHLHKLDSSGSCQSRSELYSAGHAA